MNRARLLAAVCCLIGVQMPSIAAAQNLEAGKSPGQIFSNTCNACHRSPRGLLRTVPQGSLPGFLREHYTTSREMAQQLSGFLIANGATDTRGRPQDARQQPAGSEPVQQQARPPRQIEQQQPQQQQPQQQQAQQKQSVRPPDPEERPLTRRERRERRAKNLPETPPAAVETVRRDPSEGKQKNRRSRITPARIEAASERGKEALPLGSIVKSEPQAEPAKPEAALPEAAAVTAPEAAKPLVPSATSEIPTRADPVPQVTPASPSESSRSAPSNADANPPAEAAPPEAVRPSDEPPSGAIASPPTPESPPPADSAPPKPPISQ